jgi:hypothetical protein
MSAVLINGPLGQIGLAEIAEQQAHATVAGRCAGDLDLASDQTADHRAAHVADDKILRHRTVFDVAADMMLYISSDLLSSPK